ncbi:MAG: hypothetical protein ACT4O0_07370 [Pseudonocardia sp.]|jgi:hypothetical protein
MIIDCDRCVVRGDACRDCVVGVFLGVPASISARPEDDHLEPDLPSGARVVQLDAPERRALDVLADQGLVPRLRLVAAPRRQSPSSSPQRTNLSDVG